jgi:hypothetical protein
VFSLVFILGCADNNQSSQKVENLVFFDLKGYFQSEIKDLKNVRNITKITEVNGQKETLKLDSIDFESDLKIFSNADINKPAWSDKYSIDSIKNDAGHLSKLNYKALDPELKIDQLELTFENDEVSKVFVSKSLSSAISKVNEKLVYNPKSGYVIERDQEITISGRNDFKVEVKFDRN